VILHSRQGGEDGALHKCSDGGEHRSVAGCDRPREETARLEATAATPDQGLPAQAISGSRPAESVVKPAPFAAPASPSPVDGGRCTPDNESRAWLESLTSDNRGEALARLRGLLLRATRFEVARRRDQLLLVNDHDLEQLARTAADAALMRAVADLDHYRGGTRFTTWAAKFALLEAAVRLRKLAWHDGQTRSKPVRAREERIPLKLQAAVNDMIEALPGNQRHVFSALGIDGMPIDVLADDLQATRGDVYRTLQGAREAIRNRLAQTDSLS
jgi:RNA polymerase sigma-70 factor, ECF subfamily